MKQPLNPPSKRALDLIVAVPALIALAPVMAGTALWIRLAMGGPVLFRQQRPGLGGRPFLLLKFRSMNEARDSEGKLLPDAQRLTSIGRLLRRTSLDELPQLWNVLRGEMSLVGPRPLLMEYLAHYTPEQARRHDVRPGVTGWAQIHGRNELPFSERLKLDLWYVHNRSLLLDLKILLTTARKVWSGQGVRLEQDLTEIDDVGLHPDTRRNAAIHRESTSPQNQKDPIRRVS